MKVAAVVHAKGKSERLPNKNLRRIGGKPLICHAIKNACDANLVKDVYIDSDSDAILKVGSAFGAIPLKRPPYLANNTITGDDLAYWQAQSLPQYDIIVQVVPTSPFTKPKTIDACISVVEVGINSSFTGRVEKFYTWSERVEGGDFLPDYWDKQGKIKNSDYLPSTFVENTGVYAFKTEFAFRMRRRIDWNSYHVFLVSQEEMVDINTEEDFKFAEVVWKGLQSLKTNITEEEASSLAMDPASMRLIQRSSGEK
jgi:CMP-N-acetylneuraminic acid synthetase